MDVHNSEHSALFAFVHLLDYNIVSVKPGFFKPRRFKRQSLSRAKLLVVIEILHSISDFIEFWPSTWIDSLHFIDNVLARVVSKFLVTDMVLGDVGVEATRGIPKFDHQVQNAA
jgi:hypothetical protein